MKTSVLLAGMASAFLALAAAATPASAITFYSFSSYQGTNFTYTPAAVGGSFTITGLTTYTINGGPYTGYADYGTVDITGSTTDPVVSLGGGNYLLNDFSGTISVADVFNNPAGTVFSGTYSGASIVFSAGGSSLGDNTVYDAVFNPTPGSITYSSSYIPVNSNIGDSFNIVLASLSSLHLTGSGATLDFRAFTATADGSFSVAGGIPEPASWALMLVGFGAVGGMLRRRRVAVAA